jgi:hypothetical protein
LRKRSPAPLTAVDHISFHLRGGKKKGIRYGLVQFDEVKSVEWWASTFCKKTRGATLYRLRDDIVYRPGHEPENTTGE